MKTDSSTAGYGLTYASELLAIRPSGEEILFTVRDTRVVEGSTASCGFEIW